MHVTSGKAAPILAKALRRRCVHATGTSEVEYLGATVAVEVFMFNCAQTGGKDMMLVLISDVHHSATQGIKGVDTFFAPTGLGAASLAADEAYDFNDVERVCTATRVVKVGCKATRKDPPDSSFLVRFPCTAVDGNTHDAAVISSVRDGPRLNLPACTCGRQIGARAQKTMGLPEVLRLLANTRGGGAGLCAVRPPFSGWIDCDWSAALAVITVCSTSLVPPHATPRGAAVT